jgi:hypothetical protein
VDKDVIKDSLGQIERQLDNAREALQQIENENLYSGSRGGYAEPEEALEAFLVGAYELIVFALQAAGLEGPLTRLEQKWAELRKRGLSRAGQTRWDSFESEPLNCLEQVVQGMRGVVGEGLKSAEASELSKLESILRRTGFLVRKRNVTPTSETDIREVIHDYLEGYFIDYTRTVAIPKPFKTFKPDGGVPSLKAAIEFKFATSREEVNKAISGVYEDMIGYSGSEDYKRYFSVLYQTDQFVPEDAYNASILRGPREWIPIITTAPGKRKPKKKELIVKASLRTPEKKTSKKQT